MRWALAPNGLRITETDSLCWRFPWLRFRSLNQRLIQSSDQSGMCASSAGRAGRRLGPAGWRAPGPPAWPWILVQVVWFAVREAARWLGRKGNHAGKNGIMSTTMYSERKHENIWVTLTQIGQKLVKVIFHPKIKRYKNLILYISWWHLLAYCS